MQTAIRREVSQLSARRRFKGYSPESEKAVREAMVKEDEVLKALGRVWRSFDHRGENFEKSEENLLELIAGISYSSRDVEKFTFALLPEFKDERFFGSKAGAFLSILINNGKDNDYVIHTEWLGEIKNLDQLSHLGTENRKNITVHGNGGFQVGIDMTAGKIIVTGDVMGMVGRSMKGGEIIVYGNADGEVGWGMRDGKIVVHGNSGKQVGNMSKGGEIHINGDNGGYIDVGKWSFRADEGAKVYHKGELIWPK